MRGRRQRVAIVVIAVAAVAAAGGYVACRARGDKEATPAEAADGSGLPRTRDGRPIVASQPRDGFAVALVYDQTRDDPVTRWSGCFRRVIACHDPDQASVTACVRQIAPCADAAGGDGCCPATCLTAFDDALAGGAAEDAAIERIFLGGTCVPGFEVADAR